MRDHTPYTTLALLGAKRVIFEVAKLSNKPYCAMDSSEIFDVTLDPDFVDRSISLTSEAMDFTMDSEIWTGAQGVNENVLAKYAHERPPIVSIGKFIRTAFLCSIYQ